MNTRLQNFIRSEGLTPSRIANIIGVQPSSISHLLSGRNKPGFDFIQKILLHFPKLNPDWLILGVGDMYRSDHPHVSNSNINDTIESKFTNVDIEGVVNITKTGRSSNTLNTSTNTVSVNTTISEPQKLPKVEKIVVFYDNRTFKEYIQE